MAIKDDKIIQLDNISWEVDDRLILDDINLSISKGEYISLIGPNGAGKSSLCKLILGLIKPTSGTVTKAQNLQVAYVPQIFSVNNIIPIKIEEFMKLSLKNTSTNEVEELLTEVELWHKRFLPIQSLSGGERQRLLIAKALIGKPDLLVLDEAFSHINFSGQEKLIQLVNNHKKQIDFSVLMVSHDMFWVMAQTDRVICVNHSISCSGKPIDISKNPIISNLLGAEFTKNLSYYNHQAHHHHQEQNQEGII